MFLHVDEFQYIKLLLKFNNNEKKQAITNFSVNENIVQHNFS